MEKLEYVVDCKYHGDFCCLSDAIGLVPDGSTIIVKSGIYNETFTINKNIQIVGDSINKPIINLDGGNSIKVSSDVNVYNIIFSNMRPSSVDKTDSQNIIDITGNAVFKNCDFSYGKNGNVEVIGANTKAEFYDCNIKNSNLFGVKLNHVGSSYFENCNIFENESVCILIEDSKASFKNCNIYNCNSYKESVGIIIKGTSEGTFEECDIHDFCDAGINVMEKSKFSFLHCSIHNIEKSLDEVAVGIVNKDKSSCKYDYCYIHDIRGAGIALFEETNPTFCNCIINYCKEVETFACGVISFGASQGNFIDTSIEYIDDIGIKLEDNSSTSFENCNICHINNIGILDKDNSRGKFNNCRVYECEKFAFSSVDNSSSYISQCEIYEIGEVAIGLKGNSKNNYINCNIHDYEKFGILVFEQAQPLIEGCEIYKCQTKNPESAKCVAIFGNEKNNGNGSIKNSKIHDFMGDGIYLGYYSCFSIENCEIFDTKPLSSLNYGISINNDSRCEIKNIFIHDIKGVGVSLLHNSNCSCDNCNFKEITGCGINIYEEANPYIKNCSITNIHSSKDNPGCGICSATLKEGCIENCEIEDVDGHGMQINKDSKLIYKNVNIQRCDID